MRITQGSAFKIIGAATNGQVEVDDPSATLTTNQRYLLVEGSLYAWNGSAPARLLTEDGTYANLRTAIYQDNNQAIVSVANSDGRGATQGVMGTLPYNHLYNGGSWDRMRNTVSTTYLASASRTATTTGATIKTYNSPAIAFAITVSAVAGGGETLTPVIQGNSPIGSNPVTLLTSGTTITATGEYYIAFGRGITSTSGHDGILDLADGALIMNMSLKITHSASGTFGYAVRSILSS